MTEMILTSSVLILTLILLRRALRGRIAPGLQYALWLLAAARLLIPGTLFPAPVSAAGTAAELREVLIQREELAPDSQGPAFNLPETAPEAVQPGAAPPPAGTGGGSVPAEGTVSLPWAVLLWGAGAAVTGGAFLVSNLAFFLQLRRGRKRLRLPLETGAWDTPVYLVKDIDSPCIFGLLDRKSVV